MGVQYLYLSGEPGDPGGHAGRSAQMPGTPDCGPSQTNANNLEIMKSFVRRSLMTRRRRATSTLP